MNASQIQEYTKIGQRVTVALQGGLQETGFIERIDPEHIILKSDDDEPILILNEHIIMIKGAKKSGGHPDTNTPAPLQTDYSQAGSVSPQSPPDQEPDPLPTEVSPSPTQATTREDLETTLIPEETPALPEPVQPDITNPELIHLKARFDAGISNSTLRTKPPTFSSTPVEISSLNFGLKNEVTKSWDWIKNKHDHCKKEDKLVRHSDDLMALIEKTRQLVDLLSLPGKAAMLRYLGYFYEKNASVAEAADAYLKAAIISDNSQDWLNTAASAIACDKKELACFALSQFFLKEPCNSYPNEWFCFVGLIIQFQAINALKSVLTQSKRLQPNEEYKTILHTVLYLLQAKPELAGKAESFMQNFLDDQPAREIALDAMQELPAQAQQSFVSLSLDIAQKRVSPLQMFGSTKGTATTKSGSGPSVVTPVKTQGQHVQGEARKKALYAQQILKDLPEAEKLFIQALEETRERKDVKGERLVVRDYERLLEQLGKHQQAIDLVDSLPGKEIEDLQILLTLYIRVKKYQDAIQAAQEILARIHNGAKVRNPNTTQKALYQNLGQCHFHLKQYRHAEANFSKALAFEPDNISLKRLIAICLFQDGKTERAKTELERLVRLYADKKSAEYLESIIKGKAAKTFDDEALFDMDNMASGNLDNFMVNYLDSCELKLLNPGKLTEGKYAGNEQDKRIDIGRLEGLTRTLNSNVPEQRSDIYLNAARILYDTKVTDNQFYRFLCRSLNSRGDHYLQDNRHPDTIMTYYLEAARVYDAVFSEDPSYKGDEQDAVNAVCRYLYFSALRRNVVPPVNRNLSIKESCEDIFEKAPDKEKFFDSLPVLFARSPKFAFYSVVKVLYNNDILKKSAFAYFEKQGIPLSENAENGQYTIFAGCWKTITENFIERENDISEVANFLISADLSATRLEQNLERIDKIGPKLHHALDRENYFNRLEDIFRLSILLKADATFEDRNSHFENILNKSIILKNNILENPTKFSIECILPTLERLKAVVEKAQDELYASSEPEFEFSSGVESYDPDDKDRVPIQIKVKNKAPGPAEQVEVKIEPNTDYFEFINDRDNIKYGTIRGKDDVTEIIEVQLRSKAIQEKAFSINLSAKYKTSWNDKMREAPGSNSISITIGKEGEFTSINPNPYIPYKIVRDKEMFFGREELINKICKNIATQSDKNYVIYGQKRAGKTSVLHHLQGELSQYDNLLVVDIGNIADYFDAMLEEKTLYVLLWNILFKIRKSIERKKKDKNLPDLEFVIPSDIDFYKHPAPMNLFSNTLEKLKEEKDDNAEWKDIRLVLLIDEFTYIYTFIVGGELVTEAAQNEELKAIPVAGGKIPSTFMQTWKAILEKGYFSVVLAAQDYYTKFREKFPNELQIIYPERITYLTRAYAEQLIDQPIRIGGKRGESRYRGKAIEQILDLTAGSPFYIQIFCDRLVQYINESKQRFITEANVKVVRDMLVKGTDNNRLDKATFDNLLNNGDPSKDAIPTAETEYILRQIAFKTQQRQWCNEAEITPKEDMQYSVPEIIQDLIQREVIEQTTNGVRIRVGLFKDWLNENRF